MYIIGIICKIDIIDIISIMCIITITLSAWVLFLKPIFQKMLLIRLKSPLLITENLPDNSFIGQVPATTASQRQLFLLHSAVAEISHKKMKVFST